jgi:hypothetical protein
LDIRTFAPASPSGFAPGLGPRLRPAAGHEQRVESPSGSYRVHRLTAAAAGGLDAVVEWQEALDDAGRPLVFNVEYAVGCMFDLDRADQVERAVADPGRADELYRRTTLGLTASVEVDGEVVAVAFNNGMGESTNSVFVGLDAQGRCGRGPGGPRSLAPRRPARRAMKVQLWRSGRLPGAGARVIPMAPSVTR